MNTWTTELEALYGLAPGEFGRTQPAWENLVHPDDRSQAVRLVEQAFETGAPTQGEWRVMWPDGSVHWLAGRWQVFKDESGMPLRMTGVNLDITERKWAEEALRESELKFRTLTEVSPQVVWTTDAAGGITYLNPYWVEYTSLTLEQMQQLPPGTPLHPDDHERVMAAWMKSLQTGEGFSAEQRLRSLDGTYRWFLGSGTPVRNERGEIERWMGICVDIDERKRAEQALREAQASLRRWNTELEQAVNVKTAELAQSQERLRAMAQGLNVTEQRERRRTATELHDHLQQMLVLGKLKLARVKRSAESLPACAKLVDETQEVLNDALKYTSTLVAELSPLVLRDHGLAAGLEWLAGFMNKHDMTVKVVAPEDGVKLPEDHILLLFQSVRELLINAWKHAGTAEATITMEARGDVLRIEVRDEGQGFDLAAAAAETTSGPSSKFGLLSMRERMRALRGSFDIQLALGKGTTATLTLPLIDVKRPSSEF